MIAKTLVPTDGPNGTWPVGTEITHRDAWRLVQMGLALPADKECQEVVDALTSKSHPEQTPAPVAKEKADKKPKADESSTT